tara:strand:- start:201 stop:686 length:486 start_codon:yes stop_codon:yes gene_type:complete
MANNDYINDTERALIDKLRLDFPECHVYGQFPQAVDANWPAIIVQLIASGTEEKFMGNKVTFGSNNTMSTGEIYGMMFKIHLIVDIDSTIVVDGTAYKQRRLLNYLMLNVANTITDLGFPSNLEIIERHLRNWQEVGYDPLGEVWGASATYMISFENYRGV